MGRPVKIRMSPARTLAMLRDEFTSWASKTEAYFARLWVERGPLETGAGSIDRQALKLLTDAFIDEKDLLVVGDWAEDPSDPRCYHEFVWGSEGQDGQALDVLSELGESAIRCLVEVPSLAERLKIKREELSDNLAWDAYWMDVLTGLGQLNAHPIVRTSRDQLRYVKRYGDTEMFSLGEHLCPVSSPSDEQLLRLKKLARSKSRFDELRCGVLRGSAYAIDWLLHDASAE